MYVQPCTTYIRDMHQKSGVLGLWNLLPLLFYNLEVLVEILDNLNCQLDARVPFRDGQHKFNNHPNAVSEWGMVFLIFDDQEMAFFFPTLLYTIKNHKEP